MSESVRIEYVPLSKLEEWPRNPKDHDLGEIHQSIGRFGFVSPVLVDERSGRIVAGHGRVQTLRQKFDLGETPPERIKVDSDGEWLIPVIRGVRFNSDTEAEAYLIADNQLTVMGGWDDAKLLGVLKDLRDGDALQGIGFDEDDVDRLMAKIEGPGAESGGEQPIPDQFLVMIECQNEAEQMAMVEKLTAEGITCRAVVS